MANSSTVSSGDLATAAQYNDLRADILDTSSGHLHDGSNGNGGVVSITATTATTSTTTGALIVAGGAGIAADVVIGDDLSLLSDSSVFNMGVGSDFKITHDGTEGATLSGNPLTLDSGADIILDAEGGDIFFKDGGTTFGSATNTSGNLIIKSGTTTAATFSGANVTFAGTVGSGAITSTGIVTGTGFTAGSAVLAESELELLDGLTAGTAIASKVVTTDANIDTSGQRNLTITGELDAGSLDISGAADIAGDLTLSGGADGALQFTNAGENSIKIPNNQASALIIEEANNAYITFVTTDSSEAITVAKATTFSAGIANSGTIAAGTWNGTDVGVAYGGTGVSTLTDGGVLLGSGTGAVTAMAVLADSEMIVGDGTTDPVAESGATLRTSIGVGTGDSPQFTGIELGHASDTTIARSGSGAITVEGTAVLLAGAQTGITSIYAAGLIMGEDAQTAIDFGTTNEMDFRVDNSARLTLTSSALYPVSNNNIDLGTSSLEFKDAFFDGTVTADAFAGPLTDNVTGNASGTALTVTQAAQTAITSVGTLTALAGGTGDLIWDTSLLSVDVSDSQVGIGVANALSKFHVRSSDASASVASSEVIATFERAGHGYMQFLSNDDTESGILFGDNDSSGGSQADADIGSMVYKHSTDGFHFRTNATSNRFEIQDDGNIIGTHGDYHVSSDQRVKKEIATISGALNKVAALRGVNFKWKDTDKGTALKMGLIAQEAEAVVPEIVNTASDTFINADGEYVRVAEGATPPSGVTGIKSVDYQVLVGLLIEAIKELKATVDAL